MLRCLSEAQHVGDFILQREGIIPVETKAGEIVKAASITRCEKEYTAEAPIMVRLSLPNLSFDGKMRNSPLFIADQLDRLLALALQQE